MSSAANHRKRSHRSEARKGGAYSVSNRRAFYREATKQRNRSIFKRLSTLFHRKTPEQAEQREAEA